MWHPFLRLVPLSGHGPPLAGGGGGGGVCVGERRHAIVNKPM